MTFTKKEKETINEIHREMLLGRIKPENALLFFQDQRNKLIVDEHWRDKNTSENIENPSMQKYMREARQIQNDAHLLDNYIKKAQDMIAKQATETQPEDVPTTETEQSSSNEEEGKIEALSVPTTNAQPQAQGTPEAKKDPVKTTINWLHNRKRQYITQYTEPENSVLINGVIDHIKPPKKEWRIAKSAAFIYRELCKAAEAGEIPLAKDAIPDFMINNLKQKDGGDITKDSLTKAENRTNPDKSRQIPTK